MREQQRGAGDTAGTSHILVAEPPDAKAADDPLASDLLFGRRVRALEADDSNVGTVLSVILKKPAGAKKKRVRHYTVEWRSPAGQATLVREYQKFELSPFLV